MTGCPRLFRSHFFGPIALLILTMLALSSTASARDMQGRLGLGYNAQLANLEAANGVPGVSLKYALSKDLAVEGIVAVATTNPGNSAYGAKFFKNLFYETNLNFYSVLGGAILSGNRRAATQFLGGFGAEFFIPGLESLGFSMEVGGSLDNMSGKYALKTMGMSFLNAGMHFYF